MCTPTTRASVSACASALAMSDGLADSNASPHVARATPTPNSADCAAPIAPNSSKKIPPATVVRPIKSAW